MKPRRPCRIRDCPRLTDDASGLCPEHLREAQRRYDERRGTANARGYNSNWRRARALYLAGHPLCEDCEERGVITIAQMVHHKDGNAQNLAPENLRALCNQCHSRQPNSGWNAGRA